jgi:hypothetical protein
VMLLFNAGEVTVPFRLPRLAPEEHWRLLLDTHEEQPSRRLFRGGYRYDLRDRTTVVLRRTDGQEEEK